MNAGGHGTDAPATRLIALGNAALMDGFSMIGIETVRDATPELLEALLANLVRREEKAVVFLERNLARQAGPWLTHVRARGGRIIVVEIPALNAPADRQSQVDELLSRVSGSQPPPMPS